jgi:hypothetical protein
VRALRIRQCHCSSRAQRGQRNKILRIARSHRILTRRLPALNRRGEYRPTLVPMQSRIGCATTNRPTCKHDNCDAATTRKMLPSFCLGRKNGSVFLARNAEIETQTPGVPARQIRMSGQARLPGMHTTRWRLGRVSACASWAITSRE